MLVEYQKAHTLDYTNRAYVENAARTNGLCSERRKHRRIGAADFDAKDFWRKISALLGERDMEMNIILANRMQLTHTSF